MNLFYNLQILHVLDLAENGYSGTKITVMESHSIVESQNSLDWERPLKVM